MLRTRVQEVAIWQRGGTAQVDAAGAGRPAAAGRPACALPEEQLRQAHERVKAAVAAALRGADPSIVRTVLAYAD